MKETKDLTLFGNGERGNGERGNRSLSFLTTYKYDVLPLVESRSVKPGNSGKNRVSWLSKNVISDNTRAALKSRSAITTKNPHSSL